MRAWVIVVACSALSLMGCAHGITVSSEWESMGGPQAQDVTALLLSAGPASDLLAGTTHGSLYTTGNPELEWKSLSTIRDGAMIYCLISDPDNPARRFAATSAGLFVSTNSGVSWMELPLFSGQPRSGGSRTLEIDPWNPRIMYTGTLKRGIWKSGDGGATWSPANAGIPGLDSTDVYDILIDFSRPDHLMAAVSSLGVVKSTDAGKSWARLTTEFTSTGSICTQLVQHAHRPAMILYGTSAGAIQKSTDGGTSWSPSRIGSAAGVILSLSSCTALPEILLAGTETGILLSKDFGSSWIDITGTLPRVPTTAEASSDGRTFYAFGEGVGLQRTTDGGTRWTRIDSQLGGATVRLIATDQTGKHVYAAMEHAVVARDSSTGFWEPASSGLPGGTITSIVVDADAPTHLFAATSLGGYESRDAGQSWDLVTRNLRVIPRNLDAHPRIKTRMLASCEAGVFISTDKGITWQTSKSLTNQGHITAFTYAPFNAGTIYGASSRAALVSRDGGFLWESSHFGLSVEDLAAITLDERDPSLAYAWTSSGGGFRSMNGGLEWDSYSPPWKQQDAVLIAFDRYEPSSAVALVNNRDLYYSRSGGGTWFSLPSETLGAQALSLWWNAPTATLYAGTRAQGMYRMLLGKSLKQLAAQ